MPCVRTATAVSSLSGSIRRSCRRWFAATEIRKVVAPWTMLPIRWWCAQTALCANRKRCVRWWAAGQMAQCRCSVVWSVPSAMPNPPCLPPSAWWTKCRGWSWICAVGIGANREKTAVATRRWAKFFRLQSNWSFARAIPSVRWLFWVNEEFYMSDSQLFRRGR